MRQARLLTTARVYCSTANNDLRTHTAAYFHASSTLYSGQVRHGSCNLCDIITSVSEVPPTIRNHRSLTSTATTATSKTIHTMNTPSFHGQTGAGQRPAEAAVFASFSTPAPSVESPISLDARVPASSPRSITCRCKDIATSYGISTIFNAYRDRANGLDVDKSSLSWVRGMEAAPGYPALPLPAATMRTSASRAAMNKAKTDVAPEATAVRADSTIGSESEDEEHRAGFEVKTTQRLIHKGRDSPSSAPRTAAVSSPSDDEVPTSAHHP